jgi:hypothetical protein
MTHDAVNKISIMTASLEEEPLEGRTGGINQSDRSYRYNERKVLRNNMKE